MVEQGRQEEFDSDASAALEPAALLAAMQAHADAGWVWDASAHTLAHPDEPARHYRVDPRTHRLSLSPALADAFRSGQERRP